MFRVLLFKRTALGIYKHEITLSNTGNTSIIKNTYGLYDGAKNTITLTGDIKKFDSLVLKKRKEGYKSNIDLGLPADNITKDQVIDKLPKYNTDIDSYYKPMKCKKFVPNYFKYPAIGQPKINGVRATVRWGMKNNGLFSAEGVIIKSHEGIIYNIRQIEEAFTKVYEKCLKDVVFDGEVYCFGEAVTNISGAARNINNAIHARLQFHCFDLAIPDVPQADRIRYRDEILSSRYSPKIVYIQHSANEHKIVKDSVIVRVVSKMIYSDDDASTYREECLTASYEGCVIRDVSAIYRFGSRPMTMMKLKKFTHGIFKVVDVIPFGFENTENNIGKGCKFVLRNDTTPATFECNPIGTVEEKEFLINHREELIGTDVTVKYYERSETNLPFHANVIKTIYG